MNPDDVLNNEEDYFLRACDYVIQNSRSLEHDVSIPLYGCYKQATVGPCDMPKPSSFNFKAKTMWMSWSHLGGLSKWEAMRRYVELLSLHVANWDAQPSADQELCWISVSLPKCEDDMSDSVKDVFDWVKEGDLDKVKQCGKQFPVNVYDDHGLTVSHWATDRGHLDILKYFVSEMKADVNCLDGDGQTPLHYAAACGHLDICKFLVNSMADTMVKDQEGLLAAEVAEDEFVRSFLRSVSF